VIRVINSSCDNIALTTSFASGTVNFFSSASDRIALVPIGIEVKPSDYTITLMGSDIEGSIPVSITPFTAGEMNTVVSGLETAYTEMDSLLRSFSSPASERLWDAASGFGIPAGLPESVRQNFGAIVMNGSESIRHMGYDIAVPSGTEIVASAGGKCVYAGTTTLLGNTVILDHGTGILTVYGNLTNISVSEGVAVTARQTLGSSAGGGICEGESVHFGIIVNGVPVNPATLLTAPLPF